LRQCKGIAGCLFLDVSNVEPSALVAVVQPPPDVLDDPLQHLDLLVSHPSLNDRSGVHRKYVKQPLLEHLHKPILPQVLHEDAQDLHHRDGIDLAAPGNNVL
jgi:hypothetical protein